MFYPRTVSVVVASLLATSLAASPSRVVNLDHSNFDEIVLYSNKSTLVEFISPQNQTEYYRFVYEMIGEAFVFASDNITIARVDADKYPFLTRRFGSHDLPFVKWFDGKSDIPETYPKDTHFPELPAGYNVANMAYWIANKTGVTAPEVPSTQEAAQQFIASFHEQHVLVAFTISWSGHCKVLKPQFEVVARTFAEEPDVAIVRVDCVSSHRLGGEFVHGFSTILYIPKGSNELHNYHGERSAQAMVDFVNEKAGTRWLVGGGHYREAETWDPQYEIGHHEL